MVHRKKVHHQVVFIRHGQSTWNKANRFIGWTDTELTDDGLKEAAQAGRILKQHGFVFDEVHASVLKRCVKTAWVVLEEMGLMHVPVKCHWRLNERSYGALVGRNKKECVAEHGVQQVKLWRRSYDQRPPPMDAMHAHYPGRDRVKYGALSPSDIPLTESLHDTRLRAVTHWESVIAPAIRAGKSLMVCGHENNLRALLMHIDGIPKEEIVDLEIPRAVPILFELDEHLQPVRLQGNAEHLSGRYLLSQEELQKIQERDARQVYDLSIRVNLEEFGLTEAVKLMHNEEGVCTYTPPPHTAALAQAQAPKLARPSAPSASASAEKPPQSPTKTGLLNPSGQRSIKPRPAVSMGDLLGALQAEAEREDGRTSAAAK